VARKHIWESRAVVIDDDVTMGFYIYIYMCVCVCVSVCVYMQTDLRRPKQVRSAVGWWQHFGHTLAKSAAARRKQPTGVRPSVFC